MAKNYFVSNNEQDLSSIYRKLILWFKEKQYELDNTEADGNFFIQAKKTGKIRTLFGTNLAFQVKIYWSKDPTVPREFTLETSTGQWLTNLAGAGVTAMFTGGFTVLTGLAGAGWSLIIENEIIGYVENDLKFKKIQKAEELEAGTSATTSPQLIPRNSSQADSIVNSNARKKALEKVAQDLHKLESAFANGILTDTEFNVKKLALENKIDEYEVEFLIEEKIDKFQKAFYEGVLNADEYEDKVKDVEVSVRKQIFQGRYEKIRTEKIAKLKEALDNGILTEEEYQAKITSEWGN
ncbi:MAG TPA: hypothetical protein DD001_23240 [Microcoleaceae bacterium UBA10368]|jgi:hypothetical protein|nr:hypothetical protein [Microcoleaceae cyanobacterium UBA10368]HCV29329.1 hypothetical protein [Microcoleaceae cyanobacterium UBA9251]